MDKLEVLVNPFEGITDFDSPDDVKKVEFEKDDLLEKALAKYEEYAYNKDMIECIFIDYNERRAKNALPPVKPDWDKILLRETENAFSPVQIDLIVQKMLEEEYHDSYIFDLMHYLIPVSHAAGNNDFALHINDKAEDYLDREWRIAFCGGLEGRKDNPISMHLFGNTSNEFGRGSKYCDFHIHGDLVDLSENLDHCKIICEGRCLLGNKLVDQIGQEKMRNCVFVAKNEDTYKELKEVLDNYAREKIEGTGIYDAGAVIGDYVGHYAFDNFIHRNFGERGDHAFNCLMHPLIWTIKRFEILPKRNKVILDE